jgi:hypothetical protein
LKPCCSVRLRNPLPRAIGYRLGRHSLKVEELGSTPTGATNSRAWGNCEPVQHAGLNPVPLPVRLRPSSPFWDRGLVGKGTPCRLRTGGFPSSSLGGPTNFGAFRLNGRPLVLKTRMDALQGQGVRFLSAPPIVDGAGVGSPSGLLNRSGLTGSEVRCLRCPPASFCQWQATSLVRRQRSFDPTRKHQFRGSVTRGARDVGCNPIAERRAVRLSLSPPCPRSTMAVRRPDKPLIPGQYRAGVPIRGYHSAARIAGS